MKGTVFDFDAARSWLVPGAQCRGGTVSRGHSVPGAQCSGGTVFRGHSVPGAQCSAGIVLPLELGASRRPPRGRSRPEDLRLLIAMQSVASNDCGSARLLPPMFLLHLALVCVMICQETLKSPRGLP